MFAGVATEWDFVEAPSQLLEEWGWDAGVLGSLRDERRRGAHPGRLVERMRRADAFGRGAWTRRQLNFTALSYGLHAAPPADLDAYTADVDARFGPYTPHRRTPTSTPGSGTWTGTGPRTTRTSGA